MNRLAVLLALCAGLLPAALLPEVALAAPKRSSSSTAARASAPRHLRLFRKLRILFEATVSRILERTGKPFMGLDVQLYKADSAQRSDFRKFDDGLKMTVDIDSARLAGIERRLADAARAGHCRYGLHRQNSALMTCIVPSPYTRDHMHFIDGASGGYAMAARSLKANYSN